MLGIKLESGLILKNRWWHPIRPRLPKQDQNNTGLFWTTRATAAKGVVATIIRGPNTAGSRNNGL
jgi:hypothetical protein